MCDSCYEKYGSPTLETEKVRQAAEAIEELYSMHGAGGMMHIVVDDWNLEDDSVEWCGKYMADKKPDACEIRVYELFKRMTVEERASALVFRKRSWC